MARLPITHSHVAAMPNVHFGRGATVGSVITTRGAIIPAAVGVDIKCGRHAVRVDRQASQLPDNLRPMQDAIEAQVPVGFARRRSRPPVSSATRTPGVIDDIPGAHKPIDDVMEHENDLAVPVHRLRQVLNIKG